MRLKHIDGVTLFIYIYWNASCGPDAKQAAVFRNSGESMTNLSIDKFQKNIYIYMHEIRTVFTRLSLAIKWKHYIITSSLDELQPTI